MRYYVVSDIHSFYTKLIDVLRGKGYFDDATPHKLIICGDVFDRGSETSEMQRFVTELIHKDEVILIRGNHEDLLYELVDNLHMWLNQRILYTHHGANGTVATLLDLVNMDLQEAILNPDKAYARIKNTAAFHTVLTETRDFFETEHYIFVHGWIPCETSEINGKIYNFYYDRNWREASKEKWEKARWLNGMSACAHGVRELGKTIVCGHYHTSYGHCYFEKKGSEYGKDADFSPYIADGIIALDGYTANSGVMNCIVIDD